MSARALIDFYKILGVDQTADAKEIKKAYRRLSKSLHPDVNNADDAQEKFDEVQKAYDVLSDKKLRQDYDDFKVKAENQRFEYNFEFQNVFDMFFRSKPTKLKPIVGESIETELSFQISDVLTETEKTIFIKKKKVCHDCKGNGYTRVNEDHCEHCEGKGFNATTNVTPFGSIQSTEGCDICNATGYKNINTCSTCEGTGLIPDDVKFTFRLLKNIVEGSVLVFEGKGGEGRQGGKSGNLSITFRHDHTDRFRIEYEYDVVSRVPIDLRLALEGGVIETLLPCGILTKVDIPKRTSNNARVCIADEGLHKKKGGRGLFYVEFDVRIPSDLTDKQVTDILTVLKGGEK